MHTALRETRLKSSVIDLHNPVKEKKAFQNQTFSTEIFVTLSLTCAQKAKCTQTQMFT